MANIELIANAQANDELREAYATARRHLGFHPALRITPQVIRGLCHRPRLLMTSFEAYYYSNRCGTLPRATRELVASLVSHETGCFY